jgi:hypothetical protein
VFPIHVCVYRVCAPPRCPLPSTCPLAEEGCADRGVPIRGGPGATPFVPARVTLPSQGFPSRHAVLPCGCCALSNVPFLAQCMHAAAAAVGRMCAFNEAHVPLAEKRPGGGVCVRAQGVAGRAWAAVHGPCAGHQPCSVPTLAVPTLTPSTLPKHANRRQKKGASLSHKQCSWGPHAPGPSLSHKQCSWGPHAPGPSLSHKQCSWGPHAPGPNTRGPLGGQLPPCGPPVRPPCERRAAAATPAAPAPGVRACGPSASASPRAARPRTWPALRAP